MNLKAILPVIPKEAKKRLPVSVMIGETLNLKTLEFLLRLNK